MRAVERRGGRRAVRRLLGLGMTVLAAACGRQTPEGGPERATVSHPVQGCWAVEVTAEGPRLDSLRSWLPAGTLPTVLRLDTLRSGRTTGDRKLYRARSYFDGRLEPGPFAAWRWLEGDSILVERPGAMSGVTLRMTRVDDHLRGTLAVFTDVMEPGQPSRRTSPVRATPASCPTDGSAVGSSSAP